MSPSMTLDEIGEMLKEGGTPEPTKIADGKVTIPEGYDIDKIGEAIEKYRFQESRFHCINEKRRLLQSNES